MERNSGPQQYRTKQDTTRTHFNTSPVITVVKDGGLVQDGAADAYLIILAYRLILFYMETFQPQRAALCVYECLRLFFLIGAYLLLQPQGETNFPWLTLITPGALFLLMALFHLHGPLYLAGKGISVITTVFWLFFSKTDIINELLYSTAALIIAPGIVFFLLLGDLLSAWMVTKIMKSSGGG